MFEKSPPRVIVAYNFQLGDKISGLFLFRCPICSLLIGSPLDSTRDRLESRKRSWTLQGLSIFKRIGSSSSFRVLFSPWSRLWATRTCSPGRKISRLFVPIIFNGRSWVSTIKYRSTNPRQHSPRYCSTVDRCRIPTLKFLTLELSLTANLKSRGRAQGQRGGWTVPPHPSRTYVSHALCHSSRNSF